MKLSVHTQTGTDTGRKVSIPKGLLLEEDKSKHVLYLEIKRYLAAQRQGTHSTKERGEIKGSTRKIRKQKGTGAARSGSIKSPIFRGGGTVFGPKPRTYELYLNKKERRLARKWALTERLREQAVTVVDRVSFSESKTKLYTAFLKGLQLENKSSLLVIAAEVPTEVRLSSRNLAQAQVISARLLSAYVLLSQQHLIVEEKVWSTLNTLWS